MTDETDALAVIALLREITDELHQLKGKSDEKTASQAEPGQGPDGPP